LSGRPWQEMIIKLSKDLGLDKNLHGYSWEKRSDKFWQI
jgi:hypothetical protein